MSNYVFFNLIERYTVAFQNLFKDIRIKRLNKSTNNYDLDIRVPYHSENKTKLYMRELNSNLETTGLKLPLLGISDPTESIVRDMSRFPLKSFNLKPKEELINLSKFKSPIPYKFVFEVVALTEYASDMHQITEQIIGNFSEPVVLPINIIPDYSLYIEIGVVLSDESIRKDGTRFDSITIENFDHMRMKTFEFTLYGYIFKPVKEKAMLKRLIFQNDEFRVVSELLNSPNDVIDDYNKTFYDLGNTLLKTLSYDLTDKEKYITQVVDLSDEISLHGEALEIKDSGGNILPYVFEYSNGEFYANDDILPSNRSSITKTGRVAFYVEEFKKGTNKFYVFGRYSKSYYNTNEVFSTYNDFNRRSVNDFVINNNSQANLTYINGGVLITKYFSEDDISDAVKIIPKKSITQRLKEFGINYINFTADSDHILFGLLDENSSYLYINGDYQLIENRSGVETTLTTFSGFTLTTTLNIKYTFTADDIIITLNDVSYTYTTSNNYVNCFIGGSQTPLYVENFYSMRNI